MEKLLEKYEHLIKELNDFRRFLKLVMRMRQLQNEYFRHKRPATLQTCIRYEREVDHWIDELEKQFGAVSGQEHLVSARQESMFG